MGVLRKGSSERMVRCLQLLRFLFAGQKEREVHHPQKVEDRRVPYWNAARFQQVGTPQAKVTQRCPLRVEQSLQSQASNRRNSSALIAHHDVQGASGDQQEVSWSGAAPPQQLLRGLWRQQLLQGRV